MLKKLESFLFSKIAGRVISRLAISAAAFLAAKAAGAGVNVDSAELSAALIAGANGAYTWLSDWRAKRAALNAPKP